MQSRITIALITGAIISATTLASAAAACSPINYDLSGSPRPMERNVASAMVRRASTVYLVTAERGRPFDVDSLLASQPASDDPGKPSISG